MNNSINTVRETKSAREKNVTIQSKTLFASNKFFLKNFRGGILYFLILASKT